MKKQSAASITAIAIAIAGFSFSIASRRGRIAAEKEADNLRGRIAKMQNASQPAKTKSAIPNSKASIDTNKVAELEAELAALRAELAAAQETQRPPRESWAERMARMKEEDPEGYAEMIKRRTERRDAMRYDLAERTANFMELDTAFMTDAERENHDLLIEKMATVWALTEQFKDPEQPPDRESMRELFGAINEARPLMDAERSTMFRQLADDLGFDGDEAQDFSGYVEDIISTTTIQPPRGMGPGRRPGP